MTATHWPFVELDAQGVAYVRDTTTKVIEIAIDQQSHGLDAEAIHRNYSDLSLPQIYAALGYYHEHLEECDRQIEERRLRAVELLSALENPGLQERLQRLKAGS